MENIRCAELSAYNPRTAEFLNGVPDSAIRDELHSYLAEYRFKLPDYRYALAYFDGHLRDTYIGESMIQKAANAIELRRLYNKSTQREEAEYQGLQRLDKRLQYASHGDRIVWASPPGSRSDGYGDYGFIFSGTIRDDTYGKKHIEMTAFRIEETSVDAYNKIMSVMRDEETNFHSAEEFLREPFILHHSAADPDILLRSLVPARNIDQKQFRIAMGVIEPLIKRFIDEARSGSSKQRLRRLFHAIENLAIELNENINFTNLQELYLSLHNNINSFVEVLGAFKPPIAGGSCGSSGGDDLIDSLPNRNIMNRLTSHILSAILGEDEDSYGSLHFHCPVCNQEHRREKGKLMRFCPNKKDENGNPIPIPEC